MRMQAKSKARLSRSRIYRAIAGFSPKRCGALLDSRGFTLVELIVSIGIIGVLATMAIPAYTQIKTSAKVARAESEVRVIDKAVNAYFIDKNTYPVTGALSVIGPEGSLIDPWGHPYVYNFPATYKDWVDPQPFNDDYDIYSMGPDGVTEPAHTLPAPPGRNNCSDDIIRAASGGTVVLGERY